MLEKMKYLFCSMIIYVKKSSQKYNKGYLKTFADMVISMILYSASPSNYYHFGFAKLNHLQRKTYVTHNVSEKLQKKYNVPKYHVVFYDKYIFSRVFKEYYGRECIRTNSMSLTDFHDFLNSAPKFIYKPLEGGQGKGIQVFEQIKQDEINDIYNSLKGTNGIIEEWIEQHPKMSQLYPDAVNIIRIQTIFDGKRCSFLCATLTIGYNNKIANASADSIFALVDVKNGNVYTDGCDYNDNIYLEHPETQIKFKGFEIPMWQDVLKMLEKAVKRVPQIGYVGWDIAITASGPIIIEGNNDGGYVGYQLAELCDGQGQKKLYQKFL